MKFYLRLLLTSFLFISLPVLACNCNKDASNTESVSTSEGQGQPSSLSFSIPAMPGDNVVPTANEPPMDSSAEVSEEGWIE